MKTRPQKAEPDTSATSAPTTAITIIDGIYKHVGRDNFYRQNVRLDHTLADGSLLTESINDHLMIAIDKVAAIEIAAGRATAYINVRNLYILVQWMLLNRIYRFADLSSASLAKYASESSNGLDYCLKATSRAAKYLKGLIKNAPDELSALKVSDVLKRLGLPSTYAGRLPALTSLVAYVREYSCLPLEQESLKCRKEKLTVGGLEARLKTVELLHVYRKKLPDGIDFKPWPQGASVLAHKLGDNAEGQTKNIPRKLAVRLIAEAFKWVIDLSGPLLTLRDERLQAAQAEGLTQGAQRELDWQAIERFNDTEAARRHSLCLAVRGAPGVAALKAIYALLPAACRIVIASMTARRKVELDSIRANSVTGSDLEGYMIETYIGKPGKIDKTPCPKIVKIAVDCMVRLRCIESSSAKRIWTGRFSDSSRMAVETHFPAFAALCGAEEYLVGESKHAWTYAHHQFRRFFAIVYVWQYDDPSLLALQHHFRHVHWRMTLVYLRDIEINTAVEEQHIDLSAQKLRQAVRGEIRLVGAFGALINKKINHLRVTLEIVDEETIYEKLVEWQESRNFIFKPGPWGFCASMSVASQQKRSACQKHSNAARALAPDGSPHPSGSNEVLCSGCHFFSADETRRQYWNSRVESLDKACSSGNLKDTLAERKNIQTRYIMLKFIREKLNA